MEKKKTSFTILKVLLVLTIITSLASIIYSNRNLIDKPNAATQRPKVFNNIDKRFADARRIRISVPEGAFNIILKEDGWHLRERADFLVSGAKISEFSKEISSLEIGEIAARSPEQFDELGVGEPMEFGFGTIIELFDAQDQSIAATHLGRKPNGLYVRKMGDNDSFFAIGKIGPFERIGDWLDYNVLNIKPLDIVSNRIQIDGAKEFEITRGANGEFELGGATNDNIKNGATIISNLKFSDVAKGSRIVNPPIVTEIFTTQSGETIELKLISQFKQYWVKIKSSNLESTLVDKRANDWAFAIDETSAKLMMKNKYQLIEN